MDSSELLLWVIVMLPFSIQISLILGIFSLNYFKLLYKIDFDKYYKLFHRLKFPLNIYRQRNVYIYVEMLNRSSNIAFVRNIRIFLTVLILLLILVNFVRFFNSMLPQQIILFGLSMLQFIGFVLAFRFGNNLKTIA